MQFIQDKCAKGTIRKDSLVKSKKITLVINTEITKSEHNEPIDIKKLMQQKVSITL